MLHVSTLIIWAIFSLFSSCLAHEDSLFTSSITYCASPDVLIVQEFDIQYFRNNQSIAFALAATNRASDLNATANVILNAYGLTPLNYTFDLCNVLQGQLCPLPEYSVKGSAYIPIPSSVELPIPGIAFKIPDLEAVAQVTLRRVETGEVAVCLQSTLSNGWTLRTPIVSATTGVFTLISLIASIFYSFRRPSSSPAVFRTVTAFSYFQHIALSGMLRLNYPLAYIAFTTNFAWSFGLFSKSTAIQKGIERMRSMTGSNLSQTSQSPQEYSDRTLSPYNLFATNNATLDNDTSGHFKEIDIGDFVGGQSTRPVAPEHSFVDPAVVTSDSETLAPGIPVFVNYMNVATGNAFMTTFFTVLFFLICSAFLALVVFCLLKYLKKKRGTRWADQCLQGYRRTVISNGLRILQICILPIFVMCFFQWSLHDNWLCTLLSVFTFLWVLAALFFPLRAAIQVVLSERKTGSEHADDHKHQEREKMIEENPVGAFVGPYRPGRRFFFIIFLLTPFLRSTFVSGARHNGFIQVVGLIVLETLYLISLIVLRPYYTRGADALEIFLSLIRLITTEKLAVDAIPRVGIGIGLAVVWCVGIVVVILNILLWCRITGRKVVEEKNDSVDEIEKGIADATTPNSESASASQSDLSIAQNKEYNRTAAVDDNERTRNTMMVQQNDK
ncbi:hypothetical protein CPB86DRAFT_807244 [Serendipita vermifera]|nr:hypothetical protein CPB86DRAFT_807244 [Serendipita vermifera]